MGNGKQIRFYILLVIYSVVGGLVGRWGICGHTEAVQVAERLLYGTLMRVTVVAVSSRRRGRETNKYRHCTLSW